MVFGGGISSSPTTSKVTVKAGRESGPPINRNDVNDEPNGFLLFTFSVPQIPKVMLVYPSCLPYNPSPESPSKTTADICLRHIVLLLEIDEQVAIHRLRYWTLKVVEHLDRQVANKGNYDRKDPGDDMGQNQNRDNNGLEFYLIM
ncbi:hypothetical protein BYT27DRAFT_7335952 [Phlegmacium glaucopus]|nr:hypothetical protein BYT27DRAFT_7335952 [Phlegmacium glaucopus]